MRRKVVNNKYGHRHIIKLQYIKHHYIRQVRDELIGDTTQYSGFVTTIITDSLISEHGIPWNSDLGDLVVLILSNVYKIRIRIYEVIKLQLSITIEKKKLCNKILFK